MTEDELIEQLVDDILMHRREKGAEADARWPNGVVCGECELNCQGWYLSDDDGECEWWCRPFEDTHA